MPNHKREMYYARQHYIRYVAYVLGMDHPLTCQDCKGTGGEYDIVDPEIGGPWIACGWCEGTGVMTPYMRALWLRLKKEDKHVQDN